MKQSQPPLSRDEIESTFAKMYATFHLTSNLKNDSTNNITAKRPTILGKAEKRIEHTLLKAEATDEHFTKLCNEAIKYRFRAICVLPKNISHCKKTLRDNQISEILEILDEILIVSVIDFPLSGAMPLDVVHMAQSAINEGADEIDMVIDVAALKSGKFKTVFDKIAMVTDACNEIPVKVILETSYLTETEIVQACAISKAANATFVKTSTGFASRGASIRDIEIMKTAVKESMGIKAAGGIKTKEFTDALVQAGADVIGTSAGWACI